MEIMKLDNDTKQSFIFKEIITRFRQSLLKIFKPSDCDTVSTANGMNIVLITDKDYFVPTCVTLFSLLKTQRADTHIYIICDNMENTYSDKFLKINNPHKIQITIVPASEQYLKLQANHPYISKAALQKFSIPELICEDKVLYLDTDIVVKKSLLNLYSEDIDNCYARVCEDLICKYEHKDNERIGNSLYFNSGIMLLNLKKMREEKITEKLIEYFKKDKLCKYMDQDSFNCVFGEKVKYADITYNYFPIYEKRKKMYKELSKVKKPVIIHYAGDKPWKNAKISLANEWIYLYKKLFSSDEFL